METQLVALGNLDVGVALDWHRGRIEEGLFSLIEDYLEQTRAQTNDPCGKHELCKDRGTLADAKRKLLHDALVRFAQKVLFVVNHETLFEATRRDHTGSWSDANGNGAGRSEAGHEGQVKTYVRVLQTVGNSILVHIDAMRNEESHEKALIEAKDRDFEAVTQIFGDTPEQAYAQLVRSLGVQVEITERRIDEMEAAFTNAASELKTAEAAAKKLCQAAETSPPTSVATARSILAGYQEMLDLTGLGESGAAKARPEFNTALRLLKGDVALNQFVQAFEGAFEKARTAAVKSENGELIVALRRAKGVYDKDKDALLPSEGTRTAVDHWAAMKSKALARLDVLKEPLIVHKAAVERQARCVAANSDVALKEARVTTLQTGLTKLFQRQSDLAVAPKMLGQYRKGAIDEAKRLGNSPAGQIIQQAFRIAIQPDVEAAKKEKERLQKELKTAKGATTPDKDEVQRLQKDLKGASEDFKRLVGARAVVDSLPTPIGISKKVLAEDANARDVLDSLIAVLRYEHLDAVRSGRGDRTEELQTTKALAESYKQRSDMIYIRPAVAYLRTSFAATTLQSNDVAWKNLLQQHGYRTLIPLLPDILERQDADNEITNEIDKQFWQTINRVRVAGGGNTNYAVAKDDLGNWYVKNYSNDINRIAQSARKLALFAGGGFVAPTPAALPPTGEGSAEQAAQQAELAKTDPAEASALGKTFRKFEENYRKVTLQAITDLRDAARGLETKIKAEWTLSGVKAAEDDKQESFDATTTINDEDAIKTKLIDLDDDEIVGIEKSEEAERLAEGLQAVKSYYDAVAGRVAGLGKTVNKPNAAQKVLSRVVLEETLAKSLAKAKKNVAAFEDAIGVMGQF